VSKADLRTLNGIVARCGQFDIARPDLTKPVYVVLWDGEEMERFTSFQAACDACEERR